MQQSGFDEKRFGKYRKKNQKKIMLKGKTKSNASNQSTCLPNTIAMR